MWTLVLVQALLSMAPTLLQLYNGSPTNVLFRFGRMFQTARIFQLGAVAKYMKTEINQQLFKWVASRLV